MGNNDDIERKKLEMPTIGDNLDNIPAGDLEKAEVSDEDQQIYEDIHSKSGWTKTKEFFNRTWHGKNKFGRYLGLGLDVGESFLPKYVARIRNIFQSNTTVMKKEAKSTPKSKTVITFGLLFLVGLLQMLGVNIGFELSADAQWVSVGVGVVGVILRLVTDRPVKLGKLFKTIE